MAFSPEHILLSIRNGALSSELAVVPTSPSHIMLKFFRTKSSLPVMASTVYVAYGYNLSFIFSFLRMPKTT